MVDRAKLQTAGWALAAFVAVFLALRLLHHDSGGGGAPVAIDRPPAAPARAAAPAGSPAGGSELTVDVAGEVRRPGVYRVPAGSRADAAVQQAGGVTGRADLTAVNLAMRLQDGQQVVVPRRGAAPGAAAAPGGSAGAGPAGAGAPTGAPAQPISLSTATVAQLDGLDGIGPTLAQRIVAYRDAHGGFHSIDELRQVEGIGDKRFQALRKSLQP